MDVTVSRLALPETWDEDSSAGRDFREYAEFVAAVREHYYGTRALAATPAEALGLARGDASRRFVALVARADGRIVGRAMLWLPLLEATTMMEGGWNADPQLPASDRAVVADRLTAAVLDLAAVEGRPWLVLETPCSPGALIPTSGVGSADPNEPDAAALLAAGFTLEQIYRFQMAETAGLTDLAGAVDEATAPGYRLAGWVGRTPPVHRAAFCALASTMVDEIPSGGVEFESQVWDEPRLREYEDLLERAGRTNVVCLALAADGTPAGYTEIAATGGRVAFQGDTLVAPGHRGRGLGRWLKLANLARLRADFPGIGYVLTDNAEENAVILAINEDIGFRTVLREGLWQRKP